MCGWGTMADEHSLAAPIGFWREEGKYGGPVEEVDNRKEQRRDTRNAMLDRCLRRTASRV